MNESIAKHIIADVRLVPLFMGFVCLIFGNRLWVLNEQVAVADQWMPWLWPWFAVVTGVVSIAYAAFPWCRWLMAASGSLMFGLFLSRAMALIIVLVGDHLNPVQGHIAGMIYTALAVMTSVVWIRVMRPATGVLRALHTRAVSSGE